MTLKYPWRSLSIGMAVASLVVPGPAPASTGHTTSRHDTVEGWESKPFYTLPMNARPYNFLRGGFSHARKSYKWRRHGAGKQLLQFNTPIQHVVIVYMENRTPDNLFASAYNTPWPPTPGNYATWGQALDLATTNFLTPKGLEWNCDPDHSHYQGFINEAKSWNLEQFGSSTGTCQGDGTNPNVYHYVTPSEIVNYETLISDWAYASHVLQSNEGPSFIAHQYAIAGQSGALGNSVMPMPTASAAAMAENPRNGPPPTPAAGSSIYYEPYVYTTGNCYTQGQFADTVNMSQNYTTSSDRSNPTYNPPCVDYPTILDSVDGALGSPPSYLDWQYIASHKDSIWAAPMAINHFYNNYHANETDSTQPFAVDKDAINFVNNLNNAGNPVRPLAALTYITPCLTESDHPNTAGDTEYGPQWLAWLVNSIGESQYWPNTTIIVTWDDWGGWYDHFNNNNSGWPYHPANNAYHDMWPAVTADGDEYGFRVPMIVISPYVQYPSYISGNLRSQGAILDYIENTFGLATLGTDDKYNDNLGDMFNFVPPAKPLPYTPVPGVSTTPNPNWCAIP